MIIQMLLAAMFAFSAASKILRTQTMVRHWNDYRYPFWLMHAIATLEALAVLGMLTGFLIPGVLKYAAALIAVLMLGAVHAHLFRAGHKPYMALNAVLMLILAIALMALQ